VISANREVRGVERKHVGDAMAQHRSDQARIVGNLPFDIVMPDQVFPARQDGALILK
jgi:hypothetical protein